MNHEVISESFDFGRIALGGIWSQLWTALGPRPSQLSHFLSYEADTAQAFLSVSENACLPAGSSDGLSALDPEIFLDRPAVERLIQTCLRCIHNPSLRSLKEFYTEMQTPFLYPAIPILRARLLAQTDLFPQIETLAHQLVCQAPDIQAVKFGLILLSFFPSRSACDLAKIFAPHDEFTLFALEVLHHAPDPYFDHLWDIAPSVQGWGRIHLIKTLLNCPECDLRVVRQWLITDGYRNSVFPQLLIPWILQKVDLPDLLSDCSDLTFDQITSMFICALESKHEKLFLKSGWLPPALKQSYRIAALSRPRKGPEKRVLDWMKSN